MSTFQVDQLDHVELFVPNRHEAAAWYRRVLGLEILSEYEFWAADPRVPLMVSSDAGNTKLKDHHDRVVTIDSVVDHAKAYSVYFSDPYGHQFEITTYDHDEVERGFVALRGQLHSNAH